MHPPADYNQPNLTPRRRQEAAERAVSCTEEQVRRALKSARRDARLGLGHVLIRGLLTPIRM